MTLTVAITTEQMQALLAVVRLGDTDRLGWWRSHSVDENAEYVLGHAFPDTWMPTGLELAMESARIRHDAALERPTAVHLFSDYLPFHRLLRSWLIERKLERDFEPLVWLPDASTEDLRVRLGSAIRGDRRGSGMYVGDVPPDHLEDETALNELLPRLVGAYAGLGAEFVAPYMDLVP
jgi:hypothetical protein